MLEVCFNSSLKNSLILAPKCSKDVAGLAFDLSEGDIKIPITWEDCPRKEIFRSNFPLHPDQDPTQAEEYFNTCWRDCVEDLERLKNAPEKIRVWLDDTPNAQCGLLFVADLLQNSDTEIHVVKLPEKIKRDDGCVIMYRGWFDVEHELFQTFLHLEKILTTDEVHQLAERWKILLEENARLRVIQDEKIVSAAEDYYDDLIRRNFPKEPCKIVRIVGMSLSDVPMHDGFIAKRVQHFIKTGELVVVSNTQDGIYRTLVHPAK